MLAMLDVSSNNHPADKAINWETVKQAGYGAVMIKATEGTDYVNPWLEEDSREAHSAGLHVGYYHYAHPGHNDPKDEANEFWQHVKDLPRDIGVSLDLEVTEGQPWMGLDRFAMNWLARIPTEVTTRTLYTNESYAANLYLTTKAYPLWLASWGKKPRRKVWGWQEGQHTIPGLSGLFDYGIYYG